jgi:4-hydroxybenzoate polyprenyltransferase
MSSPLAKFLSMIKFEHTIFALPFAYVGMVMGAEGIPSLKTILLVTLAMASARTAAMALNRIIDRKIDALNERTKNRELVTGAVNLKDAYIFTSLSIIIFELSTYFINDLAFKLSPIALFFILTYSYTKRFSWLCHIYLGATDAIAPLGGYVASSGTLTQPIWFLAMFVTFWIAGFDVLYSVQDEKFDKEHKLYSIPSVFGIKASLHIAKILHLMGFIFLILSIHTFGLKNIIGYAGSLIVAILLFIEHLLIDPNDTKKINLAFFNINSYISLVLFFTFLVSRYYG